MVRSAWVASAVSVLSCGGNIEQGAARHLDTTDGGGPSTTIPRDAASDALDAAPAAADESSTSVTPPAACTLGEALECTCPSGAVGVATCVDPDVFGPCVCPDPPPILCGNNSCYPKSSPQTTVSACCSSSGGCGVDLAPLSQTVPLSQFPAVPSDCQELFQGGIDWPTCPTYTVVVSDTYIQLFSGCCRLDGLCGVEAVIRPPGVLLELGCVDPVSFGFPRAERCPAADGQ